MTTVETLFALQQIEFSRGAASAGTHVEALRRKLPQAFLARYDGATRRGRKLVSLVRDGVCTECHMRLPIGTLFEFSRGNDCVCDNCGRILHLPKTNGQTQPAATLVT